MCQQTLVTLPNINSMKIHSIVLKILHLNRRTLQRYIGAFLQLLAVKTHKNNLLEDKYRIEKKSQNQRQVGWDMHWLTCQLSTLQLPTWRQRNSFRCIRGLTFTFTLQESGIGGHNMKMSRDIFVNVCEDESQFWHRYWLWPSSTSKSFSQIPHTGQENAVSSSTCRTVPSAWKINSTKILIH